MELVDQGSSTRRHIALTTVFVLIVARISDVGITFYFDPSLDYEGNPVVALFGENAVSLISPTIITFALAVGGLLAFWRGQSLRLSSMPQNFYAFVALWLRRVALNRKPLRAYFPGGSHWIEGFQAIRFFGLAFPWALIFGSFFAVHAWFAIWGNQNPSYRSLYAALSIGRYSCLPAFAAVFGWTLGGLLFFLIEYHLYRTRNSTGRNQ